MNRRIALASLCLALATLPAAAETRTVCTLVVDTATGERLRQEGACDTAMSPASTFKIPIALMGFDSGILTSPHDPVWPFREGYVDWRAQWKQPTDPQYWMKESVVWYSQQITERLGLSRYRAYVDAFDYGNRDISGDPGKDNGLTNAWLSSSLQITPEQQAAFLARLVRGDLPVSAAAIENTAAITDYGMQPGGWHVHGKTGAGLPRGADGTLIRGQPFGWFVGWAARDGRTVTFARLIRDSERQSVPPGFRARDAVLDDLFGADGSLN